MKFQVLYFPLEIKKKYEKNFSFVAGSSRRWVDKAFFQPATLNQRLKYQCYASYVKSNHSPFFFPYIEM